MLNFSLKKIGLFVGGVVFGTAGVKILSSKDAKNAYTHCTAAVLRMKDKVEKDLTTMKENAEDIKAAAEDINEARRQEAAQKKIEDAKVVLAEAQDAAETVE